MSHDTIPMPEWVQSFREAAEEFARGSLRFDPRAVPDTGEASRPGAYIAILSDHNSVHLGLSASPSGLQVLARGLLGLRADEPLAERDVTDGVCELMNIVAGKVKSHLSGRDGQLRLGLPMYLPSAITGGSGMESASTPVQLGPVSCTLTVHRRAREQRKAA